MSRVLQLAVLWLLPYLGPDETALQRPSDREDWFDSLMDEYTTLASKWTTSNDPLWMLEFAQGKVSNRKLRFFAVACCRRSRHFNTEMDYRNIIELAEKAADGLAILDDFRIAVEHDVPSGNDSDVQLVPSVLESDSLEAAKDAVTEAVESAAWNVAYSSGFWHSTRDNEQATLASLLRDIVGNPVLPLLGIDLSWLTWNDGTILKLARRVYDERAFDDLPILADALEDAGCDNAAILAHCRGPGPHVRGCWAVDLLLGKE